MPFVDLRVTPALTDKQKEDLKAAFGQAVSVFGKGESFLMVSISDQCDLWLGGKKLEEGAYLSFSMIGDTPDEACASFTAKACQILEDTADIPGEAVYLTFHPMSRTRWGWNGSTF